MAFIRKVKTGSGAIAVQVAHKQYGCITRIVFTALAIGKVIERTTKMSIKRFVHLLRPIRSGIVVINGKKYEAKAEIPKEVKRLLKKLKTSGH